MNVFQGIAMKRRSTSFVAVLALVAGLLVVAFGISAPSAFACTVGDPDCVTVGVGTNPTPGGGSSTPPGGGGTTTDPCTVDPNSAACKGELAARTCSALAADWATGGGAGQGRDLNALTPALLADLNADLAASGCPPWGGGTTIDPATLAQQAAASFQLPHPSGHRSPSESQLYQGYPLTWVNLWTFFWTDPATWKTLSATATAGAVWATVKATPVSLTFDPGDGSDQVSCDGPGRPWEDSDGNNAPDQGACGFQYRKVSGPGYDHPFTSTQTITWQLTWTGSGNTSGTLTERTTATSGQLKVLQIQAVNCTPVNGQCPRS